MTAPTLTPAEQIRRFIERHPGEWSAFGDPATPDDRRNGYTLRLGDLRVNVFLTGWVGATYGDEQTPVASLGPVDPCADRLTRIARRVTDATQIHGISADTLPPWLADPVRHELRRRAGELLTLAGSSPADVVSAAETVDEALCKRAPVAATISDVLATLQAIGMSCRWVVGADIPELDYVGTLECNLKTTCRQRDALLVAVKQALSSLDAYSETDKGVCVVTRPARAVLRRVLGVT